MEYHLNYEWLLEDKHLLKLMNDYVFKKMKKVFFMD